MKSIKLFFISLFVLFMTLLIIPFNTLAEENAITNEKLRNALFDNVYSIDINNDGILSLSEVNNYSGYLMLQDRDLNSDDISELSKFKNVGDIFLNRNNINDLTPFMNLNNLNYLDISNNPYDCTYLRNFGKCDDLLNLKQKLQSNDGNLVSTGLIIDYDSSIIDESTPKYKVLFVIVQDIDSDIVLLNGESNHVKFHMNDTDIKLLKEYARLFEMYIEKLTNYMVNIEVDVYITKQPITSIPYVNEARIFGSEIPELAEIIGNYDSSIVTAYTNRSAHSFAGNAGFENSDEDIKRGGAFIPYDSMLNSYFVGYFGSLSSETSEAVLDKLGYNLEDFYNQYDNYTNNNIGSTLTTLIENGRSNINNLITNDIKKLKNNIIPNADLDGYVHEFIHTLELYQIARGIKTWEFHNSLRGGQEYPGVKMNYSDNFDYEGYYLLGYTNPDNSEELGIQEMVFSNPPTKHYTTTLSNVDSPELEITLDNEKAILNWNNVDGATQYILYKSENKNKFTEIVNFSNKTSYVDNNIDLYKPYYYKVVAIKTSGVQVKRSGDSNVVSIYENVPQYTVTFNSNGGSSVTSQTVNYNSTATKPSNPTRNGYTFKRWLLNGSEYNFSTAVTGSITLTADWQKNEEPTDETLKELLQDNGYNVSSNYVSKFTIGDSIATIKSKLGSNVTIETNKTIIATGAVIRKGNESYIVVIKGDLNGDGKANSGDLLQMRKYLLEEINLTGAYKEAGIIESIGNIKSLDLLRLRQYLLGEYIFK